MKVWSCKIGDYLDDDLPEGADWPMRQAVQRAFRELTGKDTGNCFSGWGASFTEPEMAVIENREPRSTSATPEERVAEALPCLSPGYWNDGDCGRCPKCSMRPAVLALVQDYERDDENYLWLQDECNRRGALVAELSEALRKAEQRHVDHCSWGDECIAASEIRAALAKVAKPTD